jgi:hypothetical protein
MLETPRRLEADPALLFAKARFIETLGLYR